jgi:hypothetical protein
MPPAKGEAPKVDAETGPEQKPPATKPPTTPPPGVGSETGGGKGDVGGETGDPSQSPVQQTPVKPPVEPPVEPPVKDPAPPVKDPEPEPPVRPVEDPTVPPPPPERDNVYLTNRDKKRLVSLTSDKGTHSVIWGDPHVKTEVDGKTKRFDIGVGPGKITLSDGTVISWNTGAGKKGNSLKTFSIQEPGQKAIKVNTTDGKDVHNLLTGLNDAQLKEFIEKLSKLKGDPHEPLKGTNGGKNGGKGKGTGNNQQVGGANGGSPNQGAEQRGDDKPKKNKNKKTGKK